MPDTKCRAWRRLGLLLLCGALGLVFLHAGLNVGASLLLNEELAALRAQGEPLTLAEVLPGPIPAARNAAPGYRLADSSFRRLAAARGAAENAWPTAGAPPPGLLEAGQAVVEQLRRTAWRPECNFEVDWSNPMWARLPHLKSMQQLAWVMRAQTDRDLAAGRTDQAIDDVDTLFRMSRHVAAEPIMISLAVASRMERLGHAALAAVTERAPLDREQAERLRQILPPGDGAEARARVAVTERAFGLWCFENLAIDPTSIGQLDGTEAQAVPPPQPARGFISLCWSPFRKLDELTYLRLMNERIAQCRSFDAERPDDERTPAYAIGTRLLLPAMNALKRKVDAVETSRRLAVVALALASSRGREGSWPKHLETVGALPADPYTGEPFRYRRTGDAFLLYSLGPNRRDDHGVSGGPGGSDDIIWSAKPPKKGH